MFFSIHVEYIMKILFFGYNGWIASYFRPILEKAGHTIIEPIMRADDTSLVAELLVKEKPDRVISFIGRTHGEGINTIDYLEQKGKLHENIRDNLYSPLSLAILCQQNDIHFTYLGTGCIFSDIDPTQNKYTEQDDPNFFGSSYSIVKGFTDRLMKLVCINTLNVRIRMPITFDNSKRNFITKIVNYETICSIPNSMSVLPTLLPFLLKMIETKKTGTINLVNPDIISHNEILELYKYYVDPSKTWKNFSIEEQDAILKSKRSNNQLDTSLLENWYPDVPGIWESIIMCMKSLSSA
jgi:3,5-epimerase/4-reductase